jgi:class 3 adenylate cyclase
MPSDSKIVEDVLSLLRHYGWEIRYKKLEAELQAADDESGRAARELFLGWMAAERGSYEAAIRHFEAVGQMPSLAGWALVGQPFVAMRRTDFRLAHQLLDDASRRGDSADASLRATIAHLRGSVLYHEGKTEEARPLLLAALQEFGREHFGTGRVLDTLGMIYAGKDNFHAARECFEQALACRQPDDLAGLALSHGQLGRLYLDWGLWAKAEKHFQEDLALAQRIGDERGQAQMYNFLGQVALARDAWQDAAGWIDASIKRAATHGWTVLEAYARKDRALVCLAEGWPDEAENQAQKAEELFRAARFDEGLAHVNRVWGLIRRWQGRWDESVSSLRAALRHFVDIKEPAEVARTQFEIARTQRAAQEPRPLVSQALREALKLAEACRRAALVQHIEKELHAVDPEAYCAHIYQRVRGRGITEDPTSLMTGTREPMTVLYLDLKGSTDYALGRDPEEVMMTLNQMMADLVAVLRKHEAQISTFRGDGFLALLRGTDHAVRAVAAGLDLFQAIEAFNEPRAVLDLPLLTARIGISTGEVFLGNVGTYDKMDYTAIGTTANLGARLESVAEPGLPCISWQTHELVRDRFVYKEGSPRTLDLKGLGDQQMWDVVGWAKR